MRGFLVVSGFLVLLLLLIGFGYYYLSRPFSGRTNFMFLGLAGADHAAGDLTDTILYAVVDHQSGNVLLLSLPRDIWLPALRAKLNSVYHYQGLEGSKRAVTEILDQPVDYGLILNFNGLVEIIDVLGGVEVEVAKAFDDYRYPIPGKENDLCGGDQTFVCRYERLHFNAGKQLMDGQKALKFVRSRNADGEEGSDFARSLRQQRLLLAIKNRVLSPKFWLNPKRTIQLVKVVNLNVKTDFPKEKYLDLLRIATRFRSLKIQTEVLNGERLVNPPPSKKLYDDQWVLIPKNGDWSEIREYVKRLLS